MLLFFLVQAQEKIFTDNNDTTFLYFPTNFFIDTINGFEEGTALSINKWVSKHLKALEEPVLYKNYEFETYRFTWLRTFNNPISIRVEKRNNNYLMFVKRTNGAGGYDPGNLVQNDTIKLTKKQWYEIISKLKNINFWALPTMDENNGLVEDGATWIFEAKKGDKYHVVYKDMPEGTEFQELCILLLKMSNLKIPKDELY